MRWLPTRRWPAVLAVVVLGAGSVGLVLRSGHSNSASAAIGPRCSASGTVTSWLGNTFGGASDKWIQPGIQGLWVASDGTAYGESAWNEGARELRGYRNGQVFGDYTYQHDNDIPNGGVAVTGDAAYVYATVRFGNTAGVMRYDRQLKPAPFTGGTDPQGATLVVNHSFENLTALAASSNRLYVADPQGFAGQDDADPPEHAVVRVYDTANLGRGQIASFPAPRARGLAVDGAGDLWVLQQASASQPSKITRYTPAGVATGQVITGIANPSALTVDTTGGGVGRLLVTDNGPDQNVKIYTGLGSKPVKATTFGILGGVNAGPKRGTTGPRRLNGPAAIGVDGAGNFYIANNGNPSFAVGAVAQGTSLEVYKPSGKLLWQVYGMKYNTAGSIDPRTGTDVYTAFDHYKLDLSKPVGRQWTRVGWTLDRFRYPDDPRIGDQGQGQTPGNPVVRTMAGHTFLFMGNGMTDAINIFRFAGTSQTAIPSGSINDYQAKASPSPGEFIWRDTNGDGKSTGNVAGEYSQPGSGANGGITGWSIDRAGNVWQTTPHGIREFVFGGLDPKGNPIYSYANLRTFATPAPFTDVRRLAYDPASDTLTLSGYTAAHPTPAGSQGDYKFSGSTLAQFRSFTKLPHPVPSWTTVLPYTQTPSDAAHKPITLSVAGRYAFVGYFTGPDNQFNSDIHVFDLRNGAPAGVITPGPEIGGRSGNTDMEDGTTAYQTRNGAYLIFNEDDLYNKVIMYRWCPP